MQAQGALTINIVAIIIYLHCNKYHYKTHKYLVNKKITSYIKWLVIFIKRNRLAWARGAC